MVSIICLNRTVVNDPSGPLADLCRRHYITKLSFFGSVLRDDFDGESDIDVLVEFAPGHVPGWAFFGIEEELSQMLGRKLVAKLKDALQEMPGS